MLWKLKKKKKKNIYIDYYKTYANHFCPCTHIIIIILFKSPVSGQFKYINKITIFFSLSTENTKRICIDYKSQ